MLREKIEKDFKEALLKRDELLVSTLRLLRAAIFNKEKEKRYSLGSKGTKRGVGKNRKESKKAKELEKMSQLSDDEILDLISSEIKKERRLFTISKQKERIVRKRKKEMEF
jgi:Yqey-like protein.